MRTAYEESVVFEVAEGLTIEPLQPSAYVVHRDGERRNIAVDAGVARPIGADRAAFSAVPVPGDAMHIGFDKPLSRLLMRILVEAEPARGAGVDPRRPPLRWEMASGETAAGAIVWDPVTVLEDTTGGFNFGSGEVLLELPGDSERVPLDGHRLHWLRCRVATPAESGGAAYERPPEVFTITRRPDRRDPALPARRARRRRDHRRERRHARSVLHRPAPADARAVRGRMARGPRPRARRMGALGRARVLRRVRPGRPRLRLRRRARHDRARARRCARPTAGGATTAPCRRRARRCGCRATAPAAGCAATSRRAR